MRATDIDIRPAGQADLEAINRVIEAAVMTWRLHADDPLHQYANRFWKSAASMVKRPD